MASLASTELQRLHDDAILINNWFMSSSLLI